MSNSVYDCEATVLEVGSGAILLRGTQPAFGGEVTSWLYGSGIRTALDEVTGLALADNQELGSLDIGGFGRVDQQESRRLLPRLTRAAIAAASTVEKYEVMMLRGPDDPPADAFCHACGANVDLAEYQGESEWEWWPRCMEFGHQVFGAPEGETWEEGLERHRRELNRWQFRSDMGLIAPMAPLTP